MKLDKNAVDKLVLSNRVLDWFKTHKNVVLSSMTAVCLSITLAGCGSTATVNEEVSNEPGLEANDSSEVTIPGVIDDAINDAFYPEDVTNVADKKSAVITSINLVKTYAKKFKNQFEKTRESEEYTEGLRQTVAEFDALYRFVVKGESYKDTSITFDDLSTAEKIDAIDGTMSVGEIISTVEPNYKDDIKQKFQEIKTKFKNSKFKKKVTELYEEYGPEVRDKAVDIVAKGYNAASNFWDDVKEKAGKQR